MALVRICGIRYSHYLKHLLDLSVADTKMFHLVDLLKSVGLFACLTSSISGSQGGRNLRIQSRDEGFRR